MATAKAKAAPKPLAQLGAVLPKTANDELLRFAAAILAECVERAENYADVADEAGTPRDALNEGYVFVEQTGTLFTDSEILAPKTPTKPLKWRLIQARTELNEALARLSFSEGAASDA